MKELKDEGSEPPHGQVRLFQPSTEEQHGSENAKVDRSSPVQISTSQEPVMLDNEAPNHSLAAQVSQLSLEDMAKLNEGMGRKNPVTTVASKESVVYCMEGQEDWCFRELVSLPARPYPALSNLNRGEVSGYVNGFRGASFKRFDGSEDEAWREYKNGFRDECT